MEWNVSARFLFQLLINFPESEAKSTRLWACAGKAGGEVCWSRRESKPLGKRCAERENEQGAGLLTPLAQIQLRRLHRLLIFNGVDVEINVQCALMPLSGLVIKRPLSIRVRLSANACWCAERCISHSNWLAASGWPPNEKSRRLPASDGHTTRTRGLRAPPTCKKLNNGNKKSGLSSRLGAARAFACLFHYFALCLLISFECIEAALEFTWRCSTLILSFYCDSASKRSSIFKVWDSPQWERWLSCASKFRDTFCLSVLYLLVITVHGLWLHVL